MGIVFVYTLMLVSSYGGKGMAMVLDGIEWYWILLGGIEWYWLILDGDGGCWVVLDSSIG